jgi:beta-glucosidase
MPSSLTQPHTIVNAKTSTAAQPLLSGAIEGHVLVKNTNNALPLHHPQLISVFGYDAEVPYAWDAGSFASFPASNNQIQNQTQVVAGGSGANNPAFISSPFVALTARAYQDGTSLSWNFFSTNPRVNPASDACLVFINSYATEGRDRSGLHDDFSDNLVNNVAASCSNTIVVIHNAGIRLVDQFVNNPNVTAIIFAHLPGQDSGYAITSILYGDTAPSGKLPYTVAKNESDYGNLLSPALPAGDFTLFPQSNFSEGVYTDYRAFDENNIEPRYEFGFGLTYTTFSYAHLQISNSASNQRYPSGPVGLGGPTDLWNVLVTVRAQVTNTGRVPAAEVAQLYVGIPGGPVRQLRGFDKIEIQPGKTEMATFQLLRKDLSVWDVVAQKWALQRGQYNIYVGSSSRILPLTGTLNI